MQKLWEIAELWMSKHWDIFKTFFKDKRVHRMKRNLPSSPDPAQTLRITRDLYYSTELLALIQTIWLCFEYLVPISRHWSWIFVGIWRSREELRMWGWDHTVQPGEERPGEAVSWTILCCRGGSWSRGSTPSPAWPYQSCWGWPWLCPPWPPPCSCPLSPPGQCPRVCPGSAPASSSEVCWCSWQLNTLWMGRVYQPEEEESWLEYSVNHNYKVLWLPRLLRPSAVARAPPVAAQ